MKYKLYYSTPYWYVVNEETQEHVYKSRDRISAITELDKLNEEVK